MTTDRSMAGYLQPYPKAPDGSPLCRWCRGPVQKPRLTFCSDDCVREFTIRTSPSAARRYVEERDHGVCALCGLDTEALRNKLQRLSGEDQAALWRRHFGGLKRRWHLWEADHIRPVVEGGGQAGLDNYRTLCLRCHHGETAKLAHRRALARKRQTVLGGASGGAPHA